MENQIGLAAGAVWRFLNEHGPATTEEIRKPLTLSESMLYMAIGWLAREGKLLFEGEGKAGRISLHEG